MSVLDPLSKPYAESTCEVRTTPLRTFNANIAVLYIILSLTAVILTWYNGRKTGPAAFDSNIYRITGNYRDNVPFPPPTVTSMVTLTPYGSSLALMGALIVGALFHLVYALDCRRLYTLLLVDRCNGMRWVQFGIIHTVLAIVVAQMLGTCSFDFILFGLLALPGLAVLGYFGDRAYPCCPAMTNVVIIGTFLILVGFWVPVITNFAYRNKDAGLTAPAYMWVALFFLLAFDILLLLSPIIQARGRISYFITETMSTLGLVVISTIVLITVGWALTEQAA